MNKLQLFLFYSLLFSASAFSQIEGIVLSDQNEPLNDVDVFLVQQNLLLKTNESGVFFLDDIIPNNSYLEFYKVGYASSVFQYKEGDKIKVFLKIKVFK